MLLIIPSVIVWDGNQNRDRTLAFAVMNTLGKSRSTEFVNLPAFSGEFHAVLFLMYFMRCLSVIISFHNGVSVSKNIFQSVRIQIFVETDNRENSCKFGLCDRVEVINIGFITEKEENEINKYIQSVAGGSKYNPIN